MGLSVVVWYMKVMLSLSLSLSLLVLSAGCGRTGTFMAIDIARTMVLTKVSPGGRGEEGGKCGKESERGSRRERKRE